LTMGNLQVTGIGWPRGGGQLLGLEAMYHSQSALSHSCWCLDTQLNINWSSERQTDSTDKHHTAH
jgi:hypothetical protein